MRAYGALDELCAITGWHRNRGELLTRLISLVLQPVPVAPERADYRLRNPSSTFAEVVAEVSAPVGGVRTP